MLLMILNLTFNFFKLMINSVYGKSIENSRERINMRLINYAEDF